MSKRWVVQVEQVVTLDILVETDGERPTDDDVYDAMCYVDNHLDSFVDSETIVGIEDYDFTDEGEQDE
jgi:hypothetical protein